MEEKKYYWLVFFLVEKPENKIHLSEENDDLRTLADFCPDSVEVYNSFYLRLIRSLGEYYSFPYNWKEKIILEKVICAEADGTGNKELSQKMFKALENRLSV